MTEVLEKEVPNLQTQLQDVQKIFPAIQKQIGHFHFGVWTIKINVILNLMIYKFSKPVQCFLTSEQ